LAVLTKKFWLFLAILVVLAVLAISTKKFWPFLAGLTAWLFSIKMHLKFRR
jgi:hypothetical protein